MKVGTFVRGGAERVGLVVDDPQDSRLLCVDLACLAEIVRQHAQYIRWPMPCWPASLRELAGQGAQGVQALQATAAAVGYLLAHGDRGLIAAALIPAAEVAWRTPIPDAPAVLVHHGNNPVVWRYQNSRDMGGRWVTIPFLRQRPITALLGTGEPFCMPEDAAGLTCGAEMGVVIGRGGRDIPAAEAMEHVFGVTVTNDLFCAMYQSLTGKGAAHQNSFEMHASATYDKTVDGAGPIGPYVMTMEEAGNPYDLLMYTRSQGQRRDRSHTGAYALGIEEMIAYISRFMTLEPGMILSLGAAGWDGFAVWPDGQRIMPTTLEVELERLGTLHTPVVAQAQPPASPYLALRRAHGLADLPEHSGSLWVLKGNYRGCHEVPGLERGCAPCPHLYPRISLRQEDAPLVLPQHARTIWCSCELAAVIGPQPVYRVPAEQVAFYLAGYAVLAAFQDRSLEEGAADRTVYNWRSADYMGRLGDGLNRLSTDLADPRSMVEGREMTIEVEGVGSLTANTADYVHKMAQVVSFLSQGHTLLPGDVISLGRLADVLVLPADQRLPARCRARAAIRGLGEVSLIIDDMRSSSRRTA